MHSADIAFKPNNDGWGYSPAYASGYDNIFGKKKGSTADTEPTAAATAQPAAQALDARDALVLRRILRENGEGLADILEAAGWRRA
jgi:hypothetical protein